MKRCFLPLLALFLVALSEVRAAQLRLPPYTRVALSNGIVALLMEQHEVPLVSFNVLVSAGSVADPQGKEGLASITSELLRRGTRTRSAEQLASELDFLGGLLDFNTGLDFTTGGAEFLAKDTAAGMELLADVLFEPAFPKEEVEKRMQQRIDELKQEKDEPQTVITNYFAAFLFGNHPYSRPIDGDERTVASFTPDEIREFYKRYYVPQNIRIAVAGDFSTAEMTRQLQ